MCQSPDEATAKRRKLRIRHLALPARTILQSRLRSLTFQKDTRALAAVAPHPSIGIYHTTSRLYNCSLRHYHHALPNLLENQSKQSEGGKTRPGLLGLMTPRSQYRRHASGGRCCLIQVNNLRFHFEGCVFHPVFSTSCGPCGNVGLEVVMENGPKIEVGACR